MPDVLEIEIEYFGAFSRFKEESPLKMDVVIGTKTSDLKAKLYSYLKEYDDGNLLGLINSSAIADDDRVYNSTDEIFKSGKYAILPPVNGG